MSAGGATDDAAARRDRAYMRRALALARRGWGRTAPNPMVGAVVVRDGRIVGEGWHAEYGGPHAEVVALAAAGELARGATLYVTLEPCAHHGKTPPCTDAILRNGIARVIVAARDPNPAAAGGLARLAAAGVRVEAGVEEAAARELDPPFFFRFRADRPWVTLKLALSVDGAIADHTRRPGWLTSPASRRQVHRLRAAADAVAVGIGTALADDPALTVRGVRAPRVPPRRVVFDREARLPLTSRLVRTAHDVPTLVLAARDDTARASALRAAGVEVLAAATLDEAMRALAVRDVRSLLVEGGAALAGALLDRRLVDRLVIFQAPLLLGAGALPAFATAPARTVREARRLRVLSRRALADDLMTVYALDEP
ncbi:MAG TPA: bifunctional diaminohydroxyphosphoribosylaminopyrimidine deaminase/5-amino-6-(5-phosphoribosylamino)uracil reductase RibD [Gemmatimonadaceae bacterium]|nr:bifunctional diaminohydroxyphosphoribosylaminopyrimidine deaminase/5-amino-6-(5-phosphoribosylamino)uracil reductase RibD [Gemmatimonadaceae bacterium]